jgi:hypothetical protein
MIDTFGFDIRMAIRFAPGAAAGSGRVGPRIPFVTDPGQTRSLVNNVRPIAGAGAGAICEAVN